MTIIHTLNERSQQILAHLVDLYVETGEPVGSRTLCQRMGLSISPATIRNIMADLEDAGLLYAPHTSAGRLPTDAGLRFFVDGLLQWGESSHIPEVDLLATQSHGDISSLLDGMLKQLSGLTQCAGVVSAPKCEARLKHVEFVGLNPYRVLVILVTDEGVVENRVIESQERIPPSALEEANRYIASYLGGRTLQDIQTCITQNMERFRASIAEHAQQLVARGLAMWQDSEEAGTLIIRGQNHLLQDVQSLQDLERVRDLFEIFEQQKSLQRLLDDVVQADGVQIFIGSENQRFCDLSGCSVVMAPFASGEKKIIGAIGVIGPTRMNYGRIIPLVDYTAKLVGHMLGADQFST